MGKNEGKVNGGKREGTHERRPKTNKQTTTNRQQAINKRAAKSQAGRKGGRRGGQTVWQARYAKKIYRCIVHVVTAEGRGVWTRCSAQGKAER